MCVGGGGGGGGGGIVAELVVKFTTVNCFTVRGSKLL